MIFFLFYQILIEGIIGSSYKGDIAIDDISFTRECQPVVGESCYVDGLNKQLVNGRAANCCMSLVKNTLVASCSKNLAAKLAWFKNKLQEHCCFNRLEAVLSYLLRFDANKLFTSCFINVLRTC